MSKFQCNNCKGVYDSYTPDGYEYYHTCPQITNPAWEDPNQWKAPTAVQKVIMLARGRANIPKLKEDPNGRNENICVCGETTFAKEGKGLGVNEPESEHKNNDKNLLLHERGRGYSHIKANGKGRTPA